MSYIYKFTKKCHSQAISTENELKVSIIIIKIHSHTVVLKKHQNFQIPLELQRENITIEWSIAERASPYTCGVPLCDLCLTEKLFIAKAEKRVPKTPLKDTISHNI